MYTHFAVFLFNCSEKKESNSISVILKIWICCWGFDNFYQGPQGLHEIMRAITILIKTLNNCQTIPLVYSLTFALMLSLTYLFTCSYFFYSFIYLLTYPLKGPAHLEILRRDFQGPWKTIYLSNLAQLPATTHHATSCNLCISHMETSCERNFEGFQATSSLSLKLFEVAGARGDEHSPEVSRIFEQGQNQATSRDLSGFMR